MSFDLNKIKFVDDNSRYLVFGYFRRYQNELNQSQSSNPFCIIPELISYTCLLFYYLSEFFDKFDSEQIEVSDDKMTITKKGTNADYWNNTTYGNTWINSMDDLKVAWKMKINHNELNICIGISPQDTCSDYWSQCKQCYSYGISGTASICSEITNFEGKSPKADTGDVVQLILDLTKASLYIKVNNTEPFLIADEVIKGKDVKYKLAITLSSIGESISILDFSQVCN